MLPMKEKPIHKSLIPFVCSFKRKRAPVVELMKHKARSCAHGGKQIKGIDYWNTCAPVAQAATARIMLTLHRMSGWQCRHLDPVLALTQAPIDVGVFLKIPTGFCVKNAEGDDMFEDCCLRLLKNCCGSRDAAATWFVALTNGLEER